MTEWFGQVELKESSDILKTGSGDELVETS